MLNEDEVQNRVTYHAPSEEGKQRHGKLSESFAEIMRVIESTCPDGREKACVFTKLEEAKFWASAAVARNPDTC